ncbi:MAG: hypothetical protein ACOYXM_11115 [Actinomycetota bacterium]
MTFADADRLRAAAAAAAIVLAALSRGDALVLAVLLVVTAGRLPALTVLPALVASSWRWGSTSLEALAGGQAVLGPAGWVEPTSAAVVAWLAALAIVLAVSCRTAVSPVEVGGMGGPAGATGAPKVELAARLRGVGGMGGPAGATGAPNLTRHLPLLVAVAAGAAAAAVVAGPAPGGQVWVRLVGTAAAALIALGAALLRGRVARAGRLLDAAAVSAGLAALVAATLDAPGWSGTIDVAALGEGLAITATVSSLALVALALPSALGNRRA